MICLVTTDFLAQYDRTAFPASATVRSYPSSDDIALADAGLEECALLAPEALPVLLGVVQRGPETAPVRMLASGRPNRRVVERELRRAAGEAFDGDVLEHVRAVRNYDDKDAALTSFEEFLAGAVEPGYLRATIAAAEECLLNGVFDASAELRQVERDASYTLEDPVELSWGIKDGLLITRVQDPHGTFRRDDLMASMLARFCGVERASLSPGLNQGLATMIRNCGALSIHVRRGHSTTVTMTTDTRVQYRSFVAGGRVLAFCDTV